MIRTDGVVFDLDGTLWDTNAVCAAVWNEVVRELGLATPVVVTEEDIRRVAGLPHRGCVREVFPDLSDADVDTLAEVTATRDNDGIAARGGVLYPGVAETVRALAARVPVCIVSNCQAGYIEIFLAQAGLRDAVCDHECWGSTGLDKSANLSAVVARNGLSKPIYVGDTAGDERAARDVGLPFVLARWGFGVAERPDAAIDRLTDLPALLELVSRAR